jgi:hypothetical protein
MSVKITCISKDNGNHMNPHERITNMNWTNESTGTTGRNTLDEMVAFVEKHGDRAAYVKDWKGDVAYIDVVTPKETWRKKYLKTYADGIFNDNLLALDECRA